MHNINRLIQEALRECELVDALRADKPLDHDEAYAGYELRVDMHEDPRGWFPELRMDNV